MIGVHRGEIAVICDGCEALLTAPSAAAAAERMYRQHWRINGADYGWRHFCPACAIEFEADRPVSPDEIN